MFLTCLKNEVFINNDVIEFLDYFSKLLIEWRHFSLIAKSTLKDICQWHFCEAFSIIPLLAKNNEVVDFGAGGGVIGVPLLKYGFNISLVERSENKLFFLQNVLNLDRVYSFVHDYSNKIIIVRGVSCILNLLRLLYPCKKLILFKSLLVDIEIKEALKFFSFKYKIYPRVSLAYGKIVVIDEIIKKN